MMKFRSMDEFAEYTDMETLLDIQYHINNALEKIRLDSLAKSPSGSASANISIALYENHFLLIEFRYSWENELFIDDDEVSITVLTLDEWLDYYNENKTHFKLTSDMD